MSLIKWTPRNTFLSPFVGESMLSDMDRFINSFFSGGLDMNTVRGADWLPAFDVIEKDKESEVRPPVNIQTIMCNHFQTVS